MSSVSNRGTALVTGASSGIGEETARELQKRGFTVYAAARRVERMAGLKADGINVLKMDVTDEKSVKAGIAKILKETGRVDVLINNAGYGSYGSVEDVPIAEAKYQFDVNVFGLALVTQLVLPHMREKRSGRIINISSIGGRIYEPLGGWYHATKFAVEGLSDSMRVELKPFGIKVDRHRARRHSHRVGRDRRGQPSQDLERHRVRRPGRAGGGDPRARGPTRRSARPPRWSPRRSPRRRPSAIR